mmetsp:Transcript_30515/g.35802  ORF Transcript_30515/g.35802 Transcript_30515/m.35802 type:complete len:219 (+) Transcript_30515:101-757(+)
MRPPSRSMLTLSVAFSSTFMESTASAPMTGSLVATATRNVLITKSASRPLRVRASPSSLPAPLLRCPAMHASTRPPSSSRISSHAPWSESTSVFTALTCSTSLCQEATKTPTVLSSASAPVPPRVQASPLPIVLWPWPKLRESALWALPLQKSPLASTGLLPLLALPSALLPPSLSARLAALRMTTSSNVSDCSSSLFSGKKQHNLVLPNFKASKDVH